MLNFYGYLYVVWTRIIKTIIIFLCMAILFGLFIYNRSVGMFIADKIGMPYDMALTFTSLGFVNSFMIVFSVIELIGFGMLINQLNKYKTINKLFNRFKNFIKIY